jgi:hypothetical protein
MKEFEISDLSIKDTGFLTTKEVTEKMIKLCQSGFSISEIEFIIK